ncbi:MAG: glycosyltransferase [Bacteroidales bacterium]|jgi:glycosyltransferase involved in cell wall biosynthesis|nr:glycosyltransferase [Bacteroidales bacterium]
MNILFLTNKMPYPPTDGGTISTLNMIKVYSKEGNNVTVLAMNTHKHNFKVEDMPEELTKNIKWHTCYVDTRIKPPEMFLNLLFSNMPYNAKRFISNTYRNKLKQILSQEKFDIVQLEGLYLYPYISTIRKSSDALIAFHAHNVEQEIWKRTVRNQNPGLKRMYNRVLSARMQRLENRSLHKFDILVPVTERDSHILDFLGNKNATYVAPTGVILSNFDIPENLPSPKHNTLFFIGALDWFPNQEGIIWFLDKVWHLVLKEYPDIELHIAGRNAPEKFEHKLNRKNVVFHGQVEDAKEFCLKYNIMISPLLTGSGMRVKLIETMALRKPIVSTYVSAEGIKVVNKIHMTLAHDEHEFANGIIELLREPEKCKMYAENARLHVEKHFDSVKIMQGLLKFYKQMLEKRKNNEH